MTPFQMEAVQSDVTALFEGDVQQDQQLFALEQEDDVIDDGVEGEK